MSFSVVLHTVDDVSGIAVFLDGIMTHLERFKKSRIPDGLRCPAGHG